MKRLIVLYIQSWLISVALCSDSSRIHYASQDFNNVLAGANA
jgi:hypothetical protein